MNLMSLFRPTNGGSMNGVFTSARSRHARKAPSRAAGRAFETLELRQLLTALVTTDKQDYAPGETVQIAARDYQAGEAIELQVLRTDGIADGPPGNVPWFVQDGDISFTAPRQDDQGRTWYPDLDGTVDGN